MSSRPRPFEKFYINIPFRLLAKVIASNLKGTFITPNIIIFIGLLFISSGCLLLILLPIDKAWISIPFILSMALFAALDGTLARYKKISNSFGSWLNVIAERIEYILIGVSFSWYSYTVTQDYLILFLCLTSLIFREGIGTTSVMTLAKMPKGWYGIYNEDFLPARCYSPSLKSKDNVPDECSSLQFEVHYSKYKPSKLEGDALIEHVIGKGAAMGLFEKNDIAVTDYRKLPYGNVLFEHSMEKNRSIVHEFLESIDIKYCGRFGEWRYLWSDQSLMSGKRVADKTINQKGD